MLGQLKKIYASLPNSVQKLAVNSLGLSPLASKSIWRKVKYLKKTNDSDFQDTTNLCNFINHKLRYVGEFASTLPYWKKRGLPHILNLDSLAKVKSIDSEELRNCFSEMVNKNIPGYYTSTGGSGRNPTKLYLSDKAYYENLAHVLWVWTKIGYQYKSRKLTLRGVDLGDELVKENAAFYEILVNLFSLSGENIDYILKAITDFGPSFGHGYPSEFFRFAELVKKKNLEDFLPDIKGISLISENFTEYQRGYIESVFGCPARSFYGHSERSAFAYELPKEQGSYCVALTYGLIEILDEEDKRVHEGESGEITCTGFINTAMPLIRYRTGDYAIVEETRKGIVTRISNIKGRWGKDFLIDTKGEKIPTTAINLHSESQYFFKYIQLLQTKAGFVTIMLVPWDFNDEKNEQMAISVEKSFSSKAKNLEFSYKIVEENNLYRTHRLKVPYLVTCLK